MGEWEVVPDSDWAPVEDDETPEERSLRESFTNKDKFKPSGRQFSNTGPDLTGQLHREAAAVHPGNTTLEAAFSPGAVSSAVDRYTLGGYGAALQAGDMAASSLGFPGNPFGGARNEGIRYRQEHPTLSQYTDIPAYAITGPLSKFAGMIGNAAERAFRSPILQAAGASGLTSGLLGGSEAINEGASLPEAGEHALESAGAGTAIGGGLGITARGAGRLGRFIQNESRGGKARQFLEKHGATVGPTGVKLPGELESMGTTDADIGRQAEASAGKGMEMLRSQKRREVNAPYTRALRDIESVPQSIAPETEDITLPNVLRSSRSLSRQTSMSAPDITMESGPPTAGAAGKDPRLAHAIGIANRALAETDPTIRRELIDESLRAMDSLGVDVFPPGVNPRPPHGDQMLEIGFHGKGVAIPRGKAHSQETGPAYARQRDVSDLVANLESAAAEINVAPQVRSQLQETIGRIKAKQGEHFNPEVDPYMLSERDINETRRLLSRFGKVGESVDEKLNPLQQAAARARGMTDEGPYAEANRQYAEGSKKFQESRKLLGITQKPKGPEESTTQVGKVKNLITRRGQNTVTAGGQEGRLREFEKRHPDIAQEFIKPELLRKKADIGFHLLPQRHGGLIERTGNAGMTAATIEGLMSMAGHGHVSPTKLALGAAGGLTLQNLPALQARLLYGPALSAQAMEPLILGEIPLLQAARNSRQEER